MAGTEKLCKIESYNIVPFLIKTTAFFRYPLEQHGYILDSGVVLVAENHSVARQLYKQFMRIEDTVAVENIKKDIEKPLNYELAIHLYQNHDNKEKICDFLNKEKYFSAVIVGGILPEFLRHDFYILKILPFDCLECEKYFQKIKVFVKANISFVCKEIEYFRSDEIMCNYNIKDDYQCFYEVLCVICYVWFLYLKEKKINRKCAKECFEILKSVVIGLVNAMERFDGDYEVGEAVRSCIFGFVDNNDIQITEFGTLDDDIEQKLQNDEVILYDSDYYYITDALFRKICMVLADTVSFLQIKKELYLEGLLICNDIDKQNYTIKKVCQSMTGDRSIRVRFLKFKHDFLISSEGLALENYIMFVKGECEEDDYEN